MNRLHNKRKRLLRFNVFESASELTLQDMNLSDDIVALLNDYKEKDLLDYWVELGDDVEGPEHDPEPVENVPIINVQLDTDRIWKYSSGNQDNLKLLLDNLKKLFFYIPKDEFESLPEILELVEDGWNIISSSERTGSFVLLKKPYILGVNFKKGVGNLIKVSVKSNKIRGEKGIEYKDYVESGKHLRVVRELLKKFISGPLPE